MAGDRRRLHDSHQSLPHAALAFSGFSTKSRVTLVRPGAVRFCDASSIRSAHKRRNRATPFEERAVRGDPLTVRSADVHLISAVRVTVGRPPSARTRTM